MWTEVLATYAAVVSTASLAVSYLSHRSGGPQLSGNTELIGKYDIEGPRLSISVHNRGRGPVTIDSIMLTGWGPTSMSRKPQPKVGWSFGPVNSQLPARIEGHSGGSWSSRAPFAVTQWLKRDDLIKLVVTIDLADGRPMNLDVDTTDIDELDPDNLPNWKVGPSENLQPGWVLNESKSGQGYSGVIWRDDSE
jgi:hypothetical protein